jgi:hypothetical protein
MNYCLHFSIRVEDELLRLIGEKCAAEDRHTDDITVEEENVLYKQALDTCIEQDEGRTWAGGNVRIGDIILIIDSDTRVVSDCSQTWRISADYSSLRTVCCLELWRCMRVRKSQFCNMLLELCKLLTILSKTEVSCTCSNAAARFFFNINQLLISRTSSTCLSCSLSETVIVLRYVVKDDGKLFLILIFCSSSVTTHF